MLGHPFGDQGNGKAERRRAIAIGLGPDFMEASAFELIEGCLPPPERGRAGERVRRNLQPRKMTPTRRWPMAIATLPLAGGGKGDRRRISKRAGGAGRGRARCGGACQRHGNLLERADLRA